jgi:hypothetical protein
MKLARIVKKRLLKLTARLHRRLEFIFAPAWQRKYRKFQDP